MRQSTLEALFTSSSCDLTGSEKYLLACLIAACDDGTTDRSVRELGKQFCISPQKLIKARNGLLDKGLIITQRVLVGASANQSAYRLQGRPRNGICVQWDRVREIFGSGMPLESQVNCESSSCVQRRYQAFTFLFSGAAASADLTSNGRIKNEGEGDRLHTEAIVLLAVLWAHASDQGVVTGLGRTEIARLAGVTRHQVMNIESKLRRLGYIESWRPGRPCKGLFGVAPAIVCLSAKVLPESEVFVSGVKSPWIACTVLDRFKGLVGSAQKVRDAQAVWELAEGWRDEEAPERCAYLKSFRDLCSRADGFHPGWEASESVVASDAGTQAADLEEVLSTIWKDRARLDLLLASSAFGVAGRYQRDRLVIYASELLREAREQLKVKPEITQWEGPIGRIRSEAVRCNSGTEGHQDDWAALLIFGIVWALAAEMWKFIEACGGDSGELMRAGAVRVVPVDVGADYQICLWPI